MFRLIVRCAFFLLGCTLMVDSLMPTFNETVQVTGHQIRTAVQTNNNTNGRTGTTTVTSDYELMFKPGKLHSCSIDPVAYNRLQDGDSLRVEATRIFKSCIKIERNDQLIYEGFAYRKIVSLVAGLFLLLIAFSWTEDDLDLSNWF